MEGKILKSATRKIPTREARAVGRGDALAVWEIIMPNDDSEEFICAAVEGRQGSGQGGGDSDDSSAGRVRRGRQAAESQGARRARGVGNEQ